MSSCATSHPRWVACETLLADQCVVVAGEGVTAARSAEIAQALRHEFDLTPAGIIQCLDLQRPLYYPTAAYGHFGRDDLDLPWERLDPRNSGAATLQKASRQTSS